MRNKLLVFIMCLFSLQSGAQVFNVDTIAYNGNPNNRINLVIMGDGYTVGELSTFRSDARLVANYFFSTPPFSLYQNFFNVFGIEVVSNESGNDHPATASDEGTSTQPVSSVDNYLQTTFDYGGTHRCIYSSQGSLVYSIANANFPMYDYINVIVNTSYYGGCAGGIAYTSMNSSSPEVFVHEFGHMFGNLSDEYSYGSSTCNVGTTQNINCTQVTDPNTIVWKNWLTTAPLPTPSGTNCSLIGAYEGAKYCSANWYRPKCNCKMRSLNQPFCEVCFEQLIYKVSTMVNYIESYTPSNSGTVTLCKNSTMNFNANVLNSANNTVRSQWFVDNVLVVNNSTNFTLDPSALSIGTHQVKLMAYDTTAHSRKTMNTYQVSWTVNVTAAPSVSAGSNGTTFCTGQALNLQSSGVGTFSWTGPNGYSSGLQNPVITNLDSSRSGTYTVTSTNSCGTDSSSLTISVSSTINTSVVAGGPTTFCAGDSVILDAGANASYSYQWFDSSGPIPGATGHNYTVLQGGTYAVNVSITSTTCSSTSASILVTVDPMPIAAISTVDPLTFCEGSSALLVANTGAGYTYQWFRDDQAIAAGTTSQWTAVLSGTYHVVSSLGACNDTAFGIEVVVNPNPSASVSLTGDTVFCVGDQVILSLPSCTLCSYQWQKNLVDITGTDSDNLTVTEAGSFRAVITDTTTGCAAFSREVLVDVHVMPLATISANGPATFCTGDSVVLSVPSVSTNTYTWYRNTVLLNGQNTSDLVVATEGSYTVEVSDMVCNTQSAAFLITVLAAPVVNMTPLPDTLCIYNSGIALNGTPFGGMFSGDGVIDSTFNPALAGSGPHTITYHYTDSNSCTASVSSQVFVDICLSNKGPELQNDFIIFPNPVSGVATIHFIGNINSSVQFVLTDIAGRKVKEVNPGVDDPGANSFKLITETYSQGVYFLEMRMDGRMVAKKLVVSHQ